MLFYLSGTISQEGYSREQLAIVVLHSMAETETLETDQVQVVHSYQKEIESLEESFKEMLQTIQEGQSDNPQVTLQHMLLLDHGTEQATVGLQSFVQRFMF